jgi:hypothetical protein
VRWRRDHSIIEVGRENKWWERTLAFSSEAKLRARRITNKNPEGLSEHGERERDRPVRYPSFHY